MQTKTIAMFLLIAIATIGAIGIGIETATQSVQGCFEIDDMQGQSCNDVNGDQHSHGFIPHA